MGATVGAGATVIRVLIVDDHAVVREGLRDALAEFDDLEVCGLAEDGVVAVARVRELLPDVVLMDLAMPRMDGVEATRQVTALFPGIRVIVVSAHDDRQHYRDAMDAGAVAYIAKGGAVEEIVDAIRATRGGGAVGHAFKAERQG